jgi:hypothetical protein
VHLEDGRAVAAPGRVAPGGEAGDAGADDDQSWSVQTDSYRDSRRILKTLLSFWS